MVYVLALVIGTHMPPSPPEPGGVNDKVLHFGAYAGLGGLLVLSGGPLGRTWLRAAAVAAFFGMVDEITQPFFSRDAELTDWFADLTGAVTGALLGRIVRDYILPRDPT